MYHKYNTTTIQHSSRSAVSRSFYGFSHLKLEFHRGKTNTDINAGSSGHRVDGALGFEQLRWHFDWKCGPQILPLYVFQTQSKKYWLFCLWCFCWHLQLLELIENYFSNDSNDFIDFFLGGGEGQDSGNKFLLLLLTEKNSVVKYVSQLKPEDPRRSYSLHTFYLVFYHWWQLLSHLYCADFNWLNILPIC